MNMGNGNRPGISLAPLAAYPGDHIRRDLIALLEFLPELRHNYPDFPTSPTAPALMWLTPWDGSREDRITITDFHPLYIDACRRIRLVQTKEGIRAIRATSRTAHTYNEELKGVTGDPWAPLDLKGSPKVLTLTGKGFTARRLFTIMLSDRAVPPLMAKPTREEAENDEPMVLISRTLVRGQCKTDGYHERNVIIRPTLKRSLAHPEDRLQAAEIADSMEKQLFQVKRMINHALRLFAVYGQTEKPGTGEKPSLRDHPAAGKVLNHFEQLVDATWWNALQDEMEATPGEEGAARNQWLLNGSNGLLDHARQALRDAVESLPTAVLLRRRAQQEALDLLETRFRAKSGFPWLFENERERRAETQNPDEAATANGAATEGPGEEGRKPTDLVANIAGYTSQLAIHRRGDLAELRRLDPAKPDS